MLARGRIASPALQNLLCLAGAKTGRVYCADGVRHMMPRRGPSLGGDPGPHLIHSLLGSPQSTSKMASVQNGCNINKLKSKF